MYSFLFTCVLYIYILYIRIYPDTTKLQVTTGFINQIYPVSHKSTDYDIHLVQTQDKTCYTAKI